ncbi:hypothetical protein QJQ45_010812 [Haematococcus lacustris]|nr:hypothetical protein QJQ45_010812 [Haematococcus lacustris]
MDGSSLEQRLAASFGSGPNARAAARQVAVDFSPLRPVQPIKDGSFAFAVARPPVPEDPLLRTPALPAAQYQPAHAPVPSHMPVSDRLPAKYRTALATRLSSGSLSPESSDQLSPMMTRPRPHSSPLRHPSPPAAALPPQEALQLQHQFAGRREEPTGVARQQVSARLYTAPTSRSRSPTAGTRASAHPGNGLHASRPRSAQPATRRLPRQPRLLQQSTSHQRPTSSQAAPAGTAQVQGNSSMAARNPAPVGMEGEAVLLAADLNSQQLLPSSPSGPGAPSPSSPSPQRSTADPRHRLSPTARRRLRAGSLYREQESLRASQERAEAHFRRFRIKQHRDDQPDVRYSQPRSQGPHVVLGQHTYSFDPAHPAMAGQHYLRSQEQEGLLAEERRLAALKQRRRTAQLATPSGSRSPSPVTGPRSMTALQREVARIARARERSRQQMQRMQEKGDAGLAAVSHLVQRRALDAINASEAITRRLAHSPSPAASPPRLRSASPHRPTSSPARCAEGSTPLPCQLATRDPEAPIP